MDRSRLISALARADSLLDRRPAEARDLARALAAQAPDRPEPLALLARAQEILGEPEPALACLRKALALAPGDRAATLAAARLARCLGRPEEAEDFLLAALDEDQDAGDVSTALLAVQNEMLDDLLSRCLIDETNYRPRDFLVTALVSAYASQEFMAECLSDLEKQTVADRLEIVVVDAASPEDERAVVAEFQRRHDNIRYIRTSERIGIYPAWNLAIRAARGRFLTPFSTNDRLRDSAYELLATALDANPGVALAYGDTILTGRPHETFEEHASRPVIADSWRWPDHSFADLLLNCRVGPHPMWRRELHAEFGYFDPRHAGVADYEFWLRLARRRPLLHIAEFTGLAWLTDSALSARDKNEADLAVIRRRYARQLRREELRMERLGAFAEAFATLAESDGQAALAYYDAKRADLGPAPELSELDAMVQGLRRPTSTRRN